jgi:GT2 family glycosyltransferase
MSPSLPPEKKPYRHRLPPFLGRFLRRCVVRFVGGAVYLTGDLLDIAVGNGLDLAKVWPKTLEGVKWPWSEGTRSNRGRRFATQNGFASASLPLNGDHGWGIEDFLFFTEAISDLKTRGRSAASPPICSIIIPVFNHADYTFQCLRSLWRHIDVERHEIIVVDNGSSDATATLLSRLDGLVRVITNVTNQGFGPACNQGAAIARGQYVVFLNNDTIVDRGWLDNLISTAETNPAAGAVGSMLLDPDRRLQEAGGIIWQDGNGCNYGKGSPAELGKFQFAREVDYCSGSSLLVRKDLFDRVGGFDQRYAPAYYEDVDLCFSIRALGFRIIYQPQSSVVHFEGVTGGTDPRSGYKRYQEINRLKFLDKWRDELDRAHFENRENNLELAAEKRRGPRIIVSDGMYSSPHHDAGSLRMSTILRMLATWARPVFVAVRSSLSPAAEALLERDGVEIKYVRGFKTHPADYRNILKENHFDLAILSRPTTASELLPLIRKQEPGIRIIYDTVDVHFRRLEREYEVTGDQSIGAEAAQKRQEEIRLAALADQVWCVTEEDRKALQNETRNTNIAIIPTIHALHGKGKNFSERRDLLFVGNFNHRPNKDAVHFFVKEIYPSIQAALPEVKFYVVGSNVVDEIMAYDSPEVVVMGYVPDMTPLLESCRVFVAPLRFGAGMKGKIGDSFSYGLPVVTTSIGAEGLNIKDREHALIADDPAFAAAVVELYRDEELWGRLSDCAYEHVQCRYTPDIVEKKILAALKDIGISA